MSVVIDANVLVSLLVADEHQSAAQGFLAEWLAVGEELHAPDVLPYEVANVLARLVFQGSLDLTDVGSIWRDLADLDVRLHRFDLASEGPEIAAVTAQLRRRHATDSAYVRLAQRLGTTLWTLDAALARNAADLGLPVKLVA